MEKRRKNLFTSKIEFLTESERCQMKRILRGVAVFLLLQLLVFSVFSVLRTIRDSQNYWGASIDKHQRLIETPPPRLILVGGSGVALGIDSEVLEQISGYHPINMSLAAGLGPDFMLREVVADLKEGDLVVVILSYGALLRNTENRCILGLLHSNPAAIRYVSSPLDIVFMYLTELPNELRNSVGSVWKSLTELLGLRTFTHGELRWRRSSFNRYGDVVYSREHSPEMVVEFHELPEPSEGYPEKTIDLLNDFHATCNSLGAVAVWSYAAVPDSTYNLNRGIIENLHQQLSANLMMDMIDDPSEVVMPFHFFSDTHYHLTREGAAIRSRILAKHILRWRLVQE